MNKKLQFKSLLLLAAMLFGVNFAWAGDEVHYTLTPASGSNNSYTSNCDIEIDGITWNLEGNSQQIPWRLGGKSLTTVNRTVYSKTPMSSAITEVKLYVGTASSITVNSLKLIVASDADFKNKIDEVSATFKASSTISFKPTSPATQWATGAYFKFVFNVSVNGNSNKYVEFKKAEFYKESSKTATTTTIDAEGLNTNLFTGTSAGQLTATVTAGGTALTNAAITWTSSAPTVATVDESGNVTLVAAGTTNIKATYAGNDNYIGSEATYELTVVNNDPAYKKATFDFSANKYNWESTSENNTYFDGSGYNATEEDITIGFSGKVRLWYANNAYTMRLYGSDATYGLGKMTLTAADGYVITGVSISGSTLSFQNPSSGTINGGEWTGSAKVLSIEKASSNSTFNKVEVSYKEGKAPTVTIDATGITNTNVFDGTAAGKLSATVTYNETAVEGATVTWSGNNDNVATIDASTGAVTLVAAGSVTFTATFAGNTNYTETSATYQMTVTNIDPNAPGTVNNPYTVAQARAAIDAGAGTQDVYAKGIVSEILKITAGDHVNFNISVDGKTTSDQLQAFHCKGATGVDVFSVQVGDNVVIKGQPGIYNGAYELGEAQLVSRTAPAVAVPTFSPAADTYTRTQNVTISCTTEGASIYYTTDGTDPTSSSTAYTGAIPVSESQTIKAIAIKGADVSLVATATYTIASIEHAGTETDPYTVADALAAIGINTGVEGVYATGIVSKIVTAYNSEYGNISYNISADGSTESDQLQAYRGKGIGGAVFTSDNDIQVGDVVVIKGNLTKYNSTYEFAADNQLVSLQRPVTIPASKYTTFASSMPISFAGTAVTAYTAKVEGKVAKLSAISDNIVPANTGVILYAETAGNYFGALSATTGGSPSGNEMVGVTAETAVPWTKDGNYNYILQGGVFKKATGAKLHAGKAYLSTDYQATSRELQIVFEGEEEATGIADVKSQKEEGGFFNLSGQRVTKPTKGLYIMNGKKMIVK